MQLIGNYLICLISLTSATFSQDSKKFCPPISCSACQGLLFNAVWYRTGIEGFYICNLELFFNLNKSWEYRF